MMEMKIDPQIIAFFEQHNLSVEVNKDFLTYKVKDFEEKVIFQFPADIKFKDLLIGIETLLDACRKNEHRGKDSLTWVSSLSKEDSVVVYLGSAFDIFVLTQALFKMGEYIREEEEFEEYVPPKNKTDEGYNPLYNIGKICYDQYFTP